MEDYEVIKDKFKQVIEYSQRIYNPQVNDLFDKWFTSKERFITAFRGELIYEYPEEVSFDLGPKERSLRVDEFIRIVEMRWKNYQLAGFIANNRDGFFENRVVCPVEFPDGTKIPKGMKLVRAFKYFEIDKEALYQIQNAASMLIQEDKISGKLCLSVHPLDYLSSSENAYNWRSCHSLDGEYRSGNLSYMVDNSTILCYLKSDTMDQLPNFPTSVPWNSKKWRMLIHFSEDMDMMFAGRQYPFSSTTAPDFIKNEVFPRLNWNSKWGPWVQDKVTEVKVGEDVMALRSPYIALGRDLLGMRDFVFEGENAMNFNDILNSSCYDPIYSYRQPPYYKGITGVANKGTKFVIGGPVKCLDCGRDPITISETMRCVCCEEDHGETDSENFGYCACCGRHIYVDNGTWIYDDLLCDHCLEKETDRCDCCGGLFYNDELTYDRDTGTLRCRYCASN